MSNALKQQSTTKESDGSATTANNQDMSFLSEGVIAYFSKRGISQETLKQYQIHSDQGAVVYPTFENGNVVNLKFRTQDKKFWQKGNKQTFWNLQSIDDAIEFNLPLLICEGENDALSAIEAGHVATVSVPAGAPSKKSNDDIDIDQDNKFAYIWELQEKLDKVNQFILAGDNDKAGHALNHELQRRLGVERCKFIRNARNDLNDVLVHDGPEKLITLINEAPNYPVKGLYELRDFPDRGLPEVFSTGLANMDPHMMLEVGRLMVVTGVPGHGKSEVTDRIVYNMANNRDWHSCVASFENAPTPNWRDSMRRKYWGRNPYKLLVEEKKEADNWIQKHFSFIAQHPDEENELSLEDILEAATISVIRYGTKILLIDPWNEIEHKRRKDETGTEYISRALRRLKSFARQYGVLVIIVAHPQKMNDKGTIKRPSLYDISGSSTWYDKADYGILAWRPDITKPFVEIDIKKIKFQHYMGRPDCINYEFDVESGDYLYIDQVPNSDLFKT